MLSVLFFVLFVCKYVLYYCHRVSTQLQLTNISIYQKVLQNGRLIRFSKRTDCLCAFNWSICNQNGHFIRCIQSGSLQGYDEIHTSWEDIISWGKQCSKTKTEWKGSSYIEEDCVYKSQSTAAKVTAELNVHLEDHFHKKKSDDSFTNPTSSCWMVKTVLKGEKYGQMSHPSRSQHQAGVMFGHHPRKPLILNASFQLWNMEPALWWVGQQYLVFCCFCTYSE